jgi:hypothetical protein
MAEGDHFVRQPGPRGCLASAAAALTLVVVAPLVFVIHRWREWRRGGDGRVSIASVPWPKVGIDNRRRLDVSFDVPLSAAGDLRRRLTDGVVRIAESLRRPDDAFHVIFRLPGGDEAVALPLGPLLQSLGERFRLVLDQGPLAGRTAIWLVLARDRALAEVVDPTTCDPESDEARERLLAATDRWSMATSWARVGPSLVIRLILVIPAGAAERVVSILGKIVPE